MIKLPDRVYFFSFFQLALITALVVVSFVEFLSFYQVNDILCTKKFIYTFIAYIIFFTTAFSPLRTLHDKAYLLHLIVCLLLLISLIMPKIAGVHRWIRLGPFSLQASEFAKITTTLALSRYLSGYISSDIRHPGHLIIPVLIVAFPVLCILVQPDLGTAVLVGVSGLITCYIAGTNKKFFLFLLAAAICSTPLIWHGVLHDYQKSRILSFVEHNTKNTKGFYQTEQSQIAMGSGGLWGKGWKKGSQSQLHFLPEKHTDFIFASWAEEFGFMGAIMVVLCFYGLISHGIRVSLSTRNHFGSYTSASLSLLLALYTLVNLAMVSGIIPVVGVPLPFISYGGSALLGTFWMMGIIACISMHRNITNI